jgi:hypothetical protein
MFWIFAARAMIIVALFALTSRETKRFHSTRRQCDVDVTTAASEHSSDPITNVEAVSLQFTPPLYSTDSYQDSHLELRLSATSCLQFPDIYPFRLCLVLFSSFRLPRIHHNLWKAIVAYIHHDDIMAGCRG